MQIFAALKKLMPEIPEIKVLEGRRRATPASRSFPQTTTCRRSSTVPQNLNRWPPRCRRCAAWCLAHSLSMTSSRRDPFGRSMTTTSSGVERGEGSACCSQASVSWPTELQNDGDQWRVVIDYPLPDAGQQGAVSDRERLDQFRRTVGHRGRSSGRLEPFWRRP